jgi:hypothetical protein
VVFASLIWMPTTRRWSARATCAGLQRVPVLGVPDLRAGVDSHQQPRPASTAGGLLLWLLEIFAAVLTCAYLWEICDALGTEHCRRRITPTTALSCRTASCPWSACTFPRTTSRRTWSSTRALADPPGLSAL